MSRRPLAALALGAFLVSLVACFVPEPVHDPESYPELSSVKAGDQIAEFRKAMGVPDAVANGWWSDSFHFDMDYQVWYYAKKGRVIFDRGHQRDLVVYTSEADETEDGRP